MSEFVPLAGLEKVGKQILTRGHITLEVKSSSVPDVPRILFLFKEPEAGKEQALNYRAGHYNTVLHLFTQTKDTTVGQGANVYKVGFDGVL